MINDLLLDYAEAHTTPEHPVLAMLNRETHLSQVYPQMLSGHLQGTLLRMFVQMIRPERVLEIGTFTGYSAISMGLGLISSANQGEKSPAPPQKGRIKGAEIHTIEVNPELEDDIRKFFHDAGLDEQIILHIGEALKIIPANLEIFQWIMHY